MLDISFSEIEAVVTIALLSSVVILLSLWLRSRKVTEDYRNILDHLNDPLMRIDIDRLEPRFCNSAFSKLMGYQSNSECISLFIQGPHLPQQNFYQIYRLCAEGRMPNIILKDCNGNGIHHTVTVDIDQENQVMDLVLHPMNIRSSNQSMGYDNQGLDRQEQNGGAENKPFPSEDYADTSSLLDLLDPELGTWEMNLALGVFQHNDFWLDHLGYQDESKNNRLVFWQSVTAPMDVLLLTDAINQAEGRFPFQVIYKLATRNGVQRTIDTKGSVIQRDEEGLPLLIRGIHKDITSEDYVRENSGKYDTQVSGPDRHELMNQLATIQGYSELILSTDNISNETREFADEILGGAERARHLVSGTKANFVETDVWLQTMASEQDLLIVGHQQLTSEFELRIIRSAIDCVLAFMTSEESSKSQREIEIVNDVDYPCSVCAISTGSQFSSIVIRSPDLSFSQSHFKHLLEEDYSTTQFHTENKLFAASKLMHKNNGHIQLMMDGRGFSVNLLLPASNKPVAAKIMDESSAGEILIIDDDRAVANYLSEVIRRAGFSATSFNDPLLALEYYSDPSTKIDLVITDLTMPEMSGEVLIQALHKLNPELPVIICSGHIDIDMTDASLAMGAAAFIAKPVDVALLLHMLSENLEVLDSG